MFTLNKMGATPLWDAAGLHEKHQFKFRLNCPNGKVLFNPRFPASRYYRVVSKQLESPLSAEATLKFTISAPPLPFSRAPVVLSIDALTASIYHYRTFSADLSEGEAKDFLGLSDSSIETINLLNWFNVESKVEENEKCALTHTRLHSIMSRCFFVQRGPKQDSEFVLIKTNSLLAFDFYTACQRGIGSDDPELDDGVPYGDKIDALFAKPVLLTHKNVMYWEVPLDIFLAVFFRPWLLASGETWSKNHDDFL